MGGENFRDGFRLLPDLAFDRDERLPLEFETDFFLFFGAFFDVFFRGAFDTEAMPPPPN